MYAIVAHFVDKTMKLQTLLLGLKKLQRSHTSENMAFAILATVDDYEIRNFLGYFVMDNAENNYTMVKSISKVFQDQHGIDYNPIEHRLQCTGHVINLAV